MVECIAVPLFFVGMFFGSAFGHAASRVACPCFLCACFAQLNRAFLICKSVFVVMGVREAEFGLAWQRGCKHQ